MKRLVKILSLLLALITCFTLVSCRKDEPLDPGKLKDGPNCGPPPWEFYPEGYTAGFPDEVKKWEKGRHLEIWWVETYEECLAAIELLNSHDSTFRKTYTSLFSYEGELFDTKYCFWYLSGGSRISWGDDPFDRYAEDILLQTWVFFEDVTIDELNYGDVEDYHAYIVASHHQKNKIEPLEDLTEARLRYEWKKDTNSRTACFVYHKGISYCRITLFSKNQDDYGPMTDECVNALLESLEEFDAKTINRYEEYYEKNIN